MDIHAPGSFNGEYEPRGDEAKADSVIGADFAVAKRGAGTVNRELAGFVLHNYAAVHPLLLGERISWALQKMDPYVQVATSFSGEPSDFTGHNTATWGELAQAAAYMKAHNLHRPILVAQAFHVGRVAMQAEKAREVFDVDWEVIVPPGLPRRFDRQSTQVWARNRALWAIREFPGAYVLKRRGQL